MHSLQSPCEPPAHSVWHLISGVIALSVLWGIGVIAWHWLSR